MTINQVSISGQIEKELIADIYINRYGIITNASFSAPIFHGYKNLLEGQPAIAGLSVTSRIFGFCGGSHQQAAVMALEHICEAKIPSNAHVVRSIIQAAEILQNSIKWFYTSFAPDLADTSFSSFPLFPEVHQRFVAFKGSSFKKGIIGGTYPISLYSLIAGQWPHTDQIFPGGVATPLKGQNLLKAKSIIENFRKKWLEPILLNGTIERYLEIDSWEDLLLWLFEKKEHQVGDLGIFIRTCLEFGLDEIGEGKNQFMSYGAFWKKDSHLIINPKNYSQSVNFPGGIFDRKKYSKVNYQKLLNFITDSHIPFEENLSSMKPFETGSLSRMIMLANSSRKQNWKKNNLLKDILVNKGSSVFVRAFARLHEMFILYNFIEKSLAEIEEKAAFSIPVKLKDGVGFGMTEAPRGALAHLVELKDGLIKKYQIFAPTIRNIQSRASAKKCAPLGNALIGIAIKDLAHPIEVGIIVRSFDACLRCNIRLLKSRSGKEIANVRI